MFPNLSPHLDPAVVKLTCLVKGLQDTTKSKTFFGLSRNITKLIDIIVYKMGPFCDNLWTLANCDVLATMSDENV